MTCRNGQLVIVQLHNLATVILHRGFPFSAALGLRFLCLSHLLGGRTSSSPSFSEWVRAALHSPIHFRCSSANQISHEECVSSASTSVIATRFGLGLSNANSESLGLHTIHPPRPRPALCVHVALLQLSRLHQSSLSCGSISRYLPQL